VEKINKSQSCFFAKTSELDKSLVGRRRMELESYKIRNEDKTVCPEIQARSTESFSDLFKNIHAMLCW
jgi:hypothetical protein